MTSQPVPFVDHRLYIKPLDAFIDPSWLVTRALITHAHADHARSGHGSVLATPETIALMRLRYGDNCAAHFQPVRYGETVTENNVRITFYPAGHVLGSAQILLEHDGCRIVVTGDYKTVNDPTAEPFEVVACDILVTEATFGLPVFQHPSPQDEIQKLLRSLSVQPERTHVIGCYALGKAQRVIRLLRDAGYDAPIYLHGAMEKICTFYEAAGVALGSLLPATYAERDVLRGAVVIAPPSALKDRWSRRLFDPVISAASGWMHIKQRAKQSLVELPLVISDHADWRELTEIIAATAASTIWVTHGREDGLVHYCRSRGLVAEPLSLQLGDAEE